MTYNPDIPVVNRVINYLNLTRADGVTQREAENIHGYIRETMALIAPFRPSNEARNKLNTYLYAHKATHMQCIVAWTMFMDLRNVANLHDVPSRTVSAA